jgi:hypothetical protein
VFDGCHVSLLRVKSIAAVLNAVNTKYKKFVELIKRYATITKTEAGMDTIDKLKALRLLYNNETEFADGIGFNRTTIWRIMNGYDFSLKTYLKIDRLYKTNVNKITAAKRKQRDDKR